MRLTIKGRVRFVAGAAALTILAIPLVITGGSSWYFAGTFAQIPCSGYEASIAEIGFPAEQVYFKNPDGLEMRGSFSRGDRFPAYAIVAVPGAAGNTNNVLNEAKILADAGFSVLIYPHRACHDSRQQHSGGYLEAQDLGRAVNFLKTMPGIKHIGVIGISTGGSAAIIAAAGDQDIEAVIAMGGFSSLRDDVLEPHEPLPWHDRLIRRFVLTFIGLRLGMPPELIDPSGVVAQISPRPLLLVYGDQEALHGQRLYDAARQPKAIWIMAGAGHAAYYEADPGEYRKMILDFFYEAFRLSP